MSRGIGEFELVQGSIPDSLAIVGVVASGAHVDAIALFAVAGALFGLSISVDRPWSVAA